ncbi:hypothetical protein BGZ99_004631 [Dissophora globulifera]|uniref:GDP-fucose protein O-fucosyltransferase 2 n=1 Tax=Dissophora globulifera TaxID=979702 RepID=A0A9P6RK04_9FUNG|nr:hypothetical protein BGZ99_004631 [Dissophora globulifera]
MSGLRSRKLVSIALILISGVLLFRLSTHLRKPELDIVYAGRASRENALSPSLSNVRSPPSISSVGATRPSSPEEDDDKYILRPLTDFDTHQQNVNAVSMQSSLSEDIPKPTMLLNPNVKYLAFMTYAGLTNQFMAFENAAYIALRLNRTLIIPPITTNSHDKYNTNQRWSEFLDLARFTSLTGVRVLEWHDVRPLTPDQTEIGRRQARIGKKSDSLWDKLADNVTCQVIYGFGDSERLHTTELTFSRQFLLRPQFVRPPPRRPQTQVFDRLKIGAKDNMNMDDVVTFEDLVDRYSGHQDHLLFLSHSFKLKDPLGKRSWEAVGQHLHFMPKVMDYAEKLIRHRAPETRKDGEFIAIHLRRGDIWFKCRSKPEVEMTSCLTPLGYYSEAVEKAFKLLGKRVPVIVTTDSNSEQDHITIARLGWRRLIHELYTTEQELGVFGPALVDAAILANAKVMIGSYTSSMSRIAASRQKSWHQRDVLYPRTTTWTPPA